MDSVEKNLIEANARKRLIELAVSGKQFPISGKVIKLDTSNQSADIERFGAVTRVRFVDVQKITTPRYERKSPTLMTKYEMSIYTKSIIAAVDRVLELYEQHCGNPDEDTAVDCPMCEQPTRSHFCAWDMNKHVHFRCTHCQFGFVQ
jgi:hypothetical protein